MLAAEITIDLNGLAVVDHFLKVFFANTDEGLGDTFSGTVTFELGRPVSYTRLDVYKRQVIGLVIAVIVIAVVLYYGIFSGDVTIVQMVKDGVLTGPVALYLH